MEKNRIKGISKTICIISKINLAIVGLGGIIIMLMMFATPMLVSNTEITDSKIKFFEEEYDYSITEGRVEIDGSIVSFYSQDNIDTLVSSFEEGNKTNTIIVAEMFFAMALATLGLIYFAILHLYKLFKNIYDEETPFNEGNVNHIKSMAKYILIAMIVSFVGGALVDGIAGYALTIDISLTEILAVLTIYALSIIFEYGYKLQQEIDTTL